MGMIVGLPLGVISTLYWRYRQAESTARRRKDYGLLTVHEIDALGGETPIQGPAWQIADWITPPLDSLATGDKCYICRSAGTMANAVDTHFFGPFGPGSAKFASVRVQGILKPDLFVAANPIKGSLPIAIVHWNRMVLAYECLDPKHGVYRAILDITPDEAERQNIG